MLSCIYSRNSSNTFLEPDLKIGATLASFQMSGNIPFAKDELNMTDRGFEI